METQLRILILYDNTTREKNLTPDWGFSCMVEFDRKKILFDTGAHADILRHNMKAMDVDVRDMDAVFISHDHWDHIGGMAVVHENPEIPVYVPVSLNIAGDHFTPMQNLIRVDAPVRIMDRICSTGQLKGIEHSMALCLPNDEVVVVAGCSHPGVREIVTAARAFGNVTTVVGGLHGFDDFDLVRDLERICPTHCTQHIQEIADQYPDKYIPGGAGKVLEF